MQNLKLFYEEGSNELLDKIKRTLESSGNIIISLEQLPISLKKQTVLLGRFVYEPKNHSLQWEDEDQVFLTIRENQVLRILVNNINKVVERQFILFSIWVDDSYYSSRCLDIIIYKLRKKLQNDNSLEIKTLKRIGFSLTEQINTLE